MVLPVAVFCQTIGPWIAHITYKAGCVAGILGLCWWSGTPGFSWVAGNFCPSLFGNRLCGCHFYFWLSYLLDVTLSLIAQQLHFWHLFLTALRLKCRICLIRVLLHPFIDWFLFFLLSFFFFIYSFCPSFQPSTYLSDNKKCLLFADVGVEQLMQTVAVVAGVAGSGQRHLWGAEQRGQPHPQDHDAHSVAPAVPALPGPARRRCLQGRCSWRT